MKILCFGVAKDIVGDTSIEVDDTDINSVKELKNHLLNKFPEFNRYKSFMIAVNLNYANDEELISSSDEIAIIPPVSGG